MKSETNITNILQIHLKILYLPVFLLICNVALSQKIQEQDSLVRFPYKIPPVDWNNIRLADPGIYPYISRKLVSTSLTGDERTSVFLDSLKNKASKTLLTRKLYDFVITPRPQYPKKEISGSSEKNYAGFTGKIIRKIEIKRLNVFGSDINNPDSFDPNKLENFLNKTHANTNEIIIRKNLLFREGDTISPLTLSDNERLLRELPFIDDARILVAPVSTNEADILVLTKDVYSLGANISLNGMDKGSFSVFEKNIFGMGHEFGVEMPYNADSSSSPGFGVNYYANNIRKSFVNLNLYYTDGFGKKTYGFDLSRKFVSSATKYAGGISIRQLSTSADLDTLPVPEKVRMNLQNYWLSRSFLIDRESVLRFIIGARYTNNNVFDHPFVLPESYHYLQQYKMFLGAVSFSIQRFYKANLVYGYGRTEDIPYGGLVSLTAGREINEFKHRYYFGSTFAIGESIKSLGYFYSTVGFSTFINKGNTEQGMLALRTNFISNLFYLGRYRLRNFLDIDYTRGFARYSDESLRIIGENGFSGFSNDSVFSAQRLSAGIESVLFSPVNFYGFRFALFGFADFGFLFDSNQFIGSGNNLTAIGLGIRIRNDNLVLNTFQIRLGIFPNLPEYSSVRNMVISGQKLMKPYNFEPGPPSLLPYR